jgi:C_GCAxxG_C_C family probable redox protein
VGPRKTLIFDRRLVEQVVVLTVTASEAIENARSLFLRGFNCAQSVMMAMQECWGIEDPVEPKVAAAFGSGIGRQGSLCGALTGGVLAIGIRYGTNVPQSQTRRAAYAHAQEFYRRFQQRCGSVFCRDLLGYDLTDPDELHAARNADAFHTVCIRFVHTAVELLADLG